MKIITTVLIAININLCYCQITNNYDIDSIELVNDPLLEYKLSNDHSYISTTSNSLTELLFYNNGIVRIVKHISDIVIDETLGTYSRESDTIIIIPNTDIYTYYDFPKTYPQFITKTNTKKNLVTFQINKSSSEKIMTLHLKYKYKKLFGWSNSYVRTDQNSIKIPTTKKIKVEDLTISWENNEQGISMPQVSTKTFDFPNSYLKLESGTILDFKFWEEGIRLIYKNDNIMKYKWNPFKKNYEYKETFTYNEN